MFSHTAALLPTSLALTLLTSGCVPKGADAPAYRAESDMGKGVSMQPQAEQPTKPTLRDAPTLPTQGARKSGEYRNVFVELGKTAEEVSARIDATYAQLFHGDPSSQTVMFAAGENKNGKLAYIKDIGSNDVRSEGMSYGMMIAVQMDKKEDFDALWNWTRTYMYQTRADHPARGYFAWQMKDDGTSIDEMPAPDGEEYIVTALFFASHRWGDGEGIFSYGDEARRILSDLKNREDIEGPYNDGKKRTRGTTLFNPKTKMVRFTPDTNNFASNGDHTDPSYHLPHFYELWAEWGAPEDAAFWREAAQASRDYFVRCSHPQTALAPDYGNFDGTPVAASWEPKTVHFRFDAWRTAMNWSVDYAWNAKDARQVELSDKLQAFFHTQRPYYGNNFTLDGQELSRDHSPGLMAMNAVASLAASDARAYWFVNQLWDGPVPTGKWRYYDGLLYTMALLHLGGEFRIYEPSAGANTSK